MTIDDEFIAAFQDLIKLGFVEDSGERRPENGRMVPVYQFSALGHTAQKYVDQGLTLEDAMALARASPIDEATTLARAFDAR